MSNQAVNQAPSPKPSGMERFLNFIERAGNKIPDPAILFFWALVITWVTRHSHCGTARHLRQHTRTVEVSIRNSFVTIHYHSYTIPDRNLYFIIYIQ